MSNENPYREQFMKGDKPSTRLATAIGALAGMAASRRVFKGAVIGGAVGWGVAHWLGLDKPVTAATPEEHEA